jgi:hypothetical protein
MIRAGIAAPLAMMLVGPAAAQQASAAANGFTVSDERPEADKKQKSLSYMITDCDYAIDRLGEKKAPNRFATLRDELVALKGDGLAGKTLRVTRYDIYFNHQAATRASVYGSDKGLIVALMKKSGVDCPREKMKGGWFSPDELEFPTSPLIVEVEATLDGQAYSVRIVHAPPRPIDAFFQKPKDAPEYAALQHKIAAALAAKLP